MAILKDSREEDFARVAEVIQESTQDEFLKLEVGHITPPLPSSNKILWVFLLPQCFWTFLFVFQHPGKIFWWKSINAREKRYNHTYSIVKTKEVGEEPQREVYQDPFQVPFFWEGRSPISVLPCSFILVVGLWFFFGDNDPWRAHGKSCSWYSRVSIIYNVKRTETSATSSLIIQLTKVRDHLGPSYMEALSHIDSVERLRAATRRVKTRFNSDYNWRL